MGRPPRNPIVWYDDFWYRAGSWDRPRRPVAKVEWRHGEWFPVVGFIVTNMSAGPEGVVDQRGQERPELVPALVSQVRCQPGAAGSIHPGLHRKANILGDHHR